MKKYLSMLLVASTLTACSSMVAVENRKTYAQPEWYQKCAQSGIEGWFWWAKEYVYACGAGESIYAQAAEEQMHAIALNNFAKRINSEVNSETQISFLDDKKSTSSKITHSVKNTFIRQHLERESGQFTMNGKYYTFVKLKMSKKDFDSLMEEAKKK